MYPNFVVIEKGNKVIYISFHEVLYSIIKASLLLWDKVSQDLTDYFFVQTI